MSGTPRDANVYAGAPAASSYQAQRRPDPRIAARIAAAVGNGSVLNVGGGTGSYEDGLEVAAALDPSAAMLRARSTERAPAVRGRAEQLPFADRSVDVALVVLSLHHWGDLTAGLAELRRVARRRIVVVTWDAACVGDFWLATDYLPPALMDWDLARFPRLDRVASLLGGARVEPLPVPHDCSDGFLGAYWRRPEAYLSPTVRRGISSLAALEDAGTLADVWERLAADLRAGLWQRRHGHLLARDAFDLGYRLVVAENQPG